MKRSDYGELAAFASVARQRSFRRAADEMGVSASALSHAVRALEERLGVRLLNRSTRSVMPTEAGARLLDRLDPALSDIAQALDELNAFRDTPRGALRLNVPRIAMPIVVMPLLPGFLARYPQIEVEVVADDALADIVAGGFDAGIRFGEQLAADMVALPIGPATGFSVVASPAYLAGRRLPRVPGEVLDHTCVRQRFPGGALFRWAFERGGQRQSVSLDAGPVFNEDASVIAAAEAGLGLAYVADALIAPQLAAGRLRRVLADWMPPPERFFLYTPGRRQMPAPLRAFVDYAREMS